MSNEMGALNPETGEPEEMVQVPSERFAPILHQLKAASAFEKFWRDYLKEIGNEYITDKPIKYIAVRAFDAGRRFEHEERLKHGNG